MRVPLALIVSLAAGLAAPRAATAQELEHRSAVVVFDDSGRANIDVSLADFVTAHGERLDRMSTGLRQVLSVRVTAVDDETDARLASATRHCAIRYDAWTEAYSLEIRRDSVESYEVFTSDVAVVERCLTLAGFPVGDATRLARSSVVHFEIVVELNPADSVDMHQVRQWLGRPDGASDSTGAFFGFFVSQFVSRIVLGLSVGDEDGDADARLVVRTPSASRP